jgi:microcystin-dependent protein
MPYVGEIRLFAGNFAPVGWELCVGQEMPISENEVLFQLIGTIYGGDGESTFRLPDLQGRVPLHRGTAVTGTQYVIGEQGGVEAVTLTVNQIPVHTHAFTASTDPGNDPNPQGNVIGSPPAVTAFIRDTPSVNMAATKVAPVGGSQPHDNRMPFNCINYIISLFGEFPNTV